MKLLNKITEIANQRVKQYGAQYYTFATLGLLNHSFTLFYEFNLSPNYSSLFLRMISAILCLLLLLKDSWPKKIIRFIPLYWFVTIAITVPVVTTFVLLQSDFSIGYLINFNIGVLILILILDSVSFLIIQFIGSFLGVSLFYLTHNSIQIFPSDNNLSLFLYMFCCIVILGSLLSKNKEIYNNFLQKSKDELNQHLQEKILERTFELEKALAAKTDFLNNMSHEIRTPVQGFVSISESLDLDWHLHEDEKRHYYMHEVAKNAKRLASLVGNLLDLTKLNDDSLFFDMHELDLNQAIEEMIDETKILYLNNKNIEIIFERLSSKNIIIGDRERIAQALRNLFINAIKFSPNDSIITVKLWVDKLIHDPLDQALGLYFAIIDQGIGLPKEELQSIFDPFTQSSRTKTMAWWNRSWSRNMQKDYYGSSW